MYGLCCCTPPLHSLQKWIQLVFCCKEWTFSISREITWGVIAENDPSVDLIEEAGNKEITVSISGKWRWEKEAESVLRE